MSLFSHNLLLERPCDVYTASLNSSGLSQVRRQSVGDVTWPRDGGEGGERTNDRSMLTREPCMLSES